MPQGAGITITDEMRSHLTPQGAELLEAFYAAVPKDDDFNYVYDV